MAITVRERLMENARFIMFTPMATSSRTIGSQSTIRKKVSLINVFTLNIVL